MINKKTKGFTMIEMITVLAIFGIMSSVVLFNYGKFRSDTILVNMAYEVALSIREAQIYGVGSRSADNGASSDFSTPYGIYLEEDSGQYILFGDTDGTPPDKEFTSCDVSGDTCVTTYTMQRGVTVTNIVLKDNMGANCGTPKNNLSIIFERPNPEPVIAGNRDAQYAVIELSSSDNTAKRYVAVYNNGQISVLNDSPCP